MLALFCLAWLQAAALPCVMAHGGAADAVASEHCPCCPPANASSPSCDDGAGCAYPHQPQVDARVAATLFVAMPAFEVVPTSGAARHSVRTPLPVLPETVPRVPLSVSYCRYIE